MRPRPPPPPPPIGAERPTNPPLTVPPLAASLLLSATPPLIAAAVVSLPSLRAASDAAPAALALSLLHGGFAWLSFRAGRSLARGHRLAVAWSASGLLLLLALSWAAGPAWTALVSPHLPLAEVPGARHLLAALYVSAAGVYAWVTSPTLRR